MSAWFWMACILFLNALLPSSSGSSPVCDRASESIWGGTMGRPRRPCCAVCAVHSGAGADIGEVNAGRAGVVDSFTAADVGGTASCPTFSSSRLTDAALAPSSNVECELEAALSGVVVVATAAGWAAGLPPFPSRLLLVVSSSSSNTGSGRADPSDLVLWCCELEDGVGISGSSVANPEESRRTCRCAPRSKSETKVAITDHAIVADLICVLGSDSSDVNVYAVAAAGRTGIVVGQNDVGRRRECARGVAKAVWAGKRRIAKKKKKKEGKPPAKYVC